MAIWPSGIEDDHLAHAECNNVGCVLAQAVPGWHYYLALSAARARAWAQSPCFVVFRKWPNSGLVRRNHGGRRKNSAE